MGDDGMCDYWDGSWRCPREATRVDLKGTNYCDAHQPADGSWPIDDPDEARLPAEVQQWRALAYASREWLYKQLKSMGNYVETGTASNCLRWLATAPPAILLAASAADAEVLRAEQEELRAYWDGGRWQNRDDEGQEEVARECSLARARILDASTHVCLPRAEAEALLSASDEAVRHLEQWPGKTWLANELCTVANKLRALLARETGKGEG